MEESTAKPAPIKFEKYAAILAPIRFGKYIGKNIEDVYKSDPEYLLWAYHNVGTKLQKKQKQFIEHRMQPRIDAYASQQIKKEDAKQQKQEKVQKLIKRLEVLKGIETVFFGTVTKIKDTHTLKGKEAKGFIIQLEFKNNPELTESEIGLYFRTTRQDFDDVQVHDKIKVKVTVSGLGDTNAFLFARKPKLLECHKAKIETVPDVGPIIPIHSTTIIV